LKEGHDFVLVSTDFLPQFHLFSPYRVPGALHRFHKATKNFIYVSRLNGKFVRTRHIQGHNRCVRCLLCPHRLCGCNLSAPFSDSAVTAGLAVHRPDSGSRSCCSDGCGALHDPACTL
jgi:hypothetical protein